MMEFIYYMPLDKHFRYKEVVKEYLGRKYLASLGIGLL